MHKTLLSIIALFAFTGGASAQLQRRAAISGGGSNDRGQCTVDVIVDGATEVNIRGDNASLRDLSGQPPQFRDFQCTAAMPANPVNFQFNAVAGRGRQTLVSDPRNGSVVVRIEDPQSGPSEYRFQLTWGAPSYGRNQYPDTRNQYPDTRNQYPDTRGQYPDTYNRDRSYNRDRYPYGESDRMRYGPITQDQAIQVCQDAVRDRAADRFDARNMDFRRSFVDQNSGRGDWVRGTFVVPRGYNRVQTYRFSCSVDFDSGRVRSVDMQPTWGGWR